MPKRIQRKRTKGWRKPPGVVNVTRPGKWSNPFLPGNYHGIGDCLADFEVYLRKQMAAGILDIGELADKDLMCWCPLDKPCHADILLLLANERKDS